MTTVHRGCCDQTCWFLPSNYGTRLDLDQVYVAESSVGAALAFQKSSNPASKSSEACGSREYGNGRMTGCRPLRLMTGETGSLTHCVCDHSDKQWHATDSREKSPLL